MTEVSEKRGRLLPNMEGKLQIVRYGEGYYVEASHKARRKRSDDRVGADYDEWKLTFGAYEKEWGTALACLSSIVGDLKLLRQQALEEGESK